MCLMCLCYWPNGLPTTMVIMIAMVIMVAVIIMITVVISYIILILIILTTEDTTIDLDAARDRLRFSAFIVDLESKRKVHPSHQFSIPLCVIKIADLTITSLVVSIKNAKLLERVCHLNPGHPSSHIDRGHQVQGANVPMWVSVINGEGIVANQTVIVVAQVNVKQKFIIQQNTVMIAVVIMVAVIIMVTVVISDIILIILTTEDTTVDLDAA